jgi:hypothetical protein
MVVVFSTCVYTIMTIPALKNDDARPEEHDSDMEDHPSDDVLNGFMSRPWVKVPVQKNSGSDRTGYSSREDAESIDDWRAA